MSYNSIPYSGILLVPRMEMMFCVHLDSNVCLMYRVVLKETRSAGTRLAAAELTTSP